MKKFLPVLTIIISALLLCVNAEATAAEFSEKIYSEISGADSSEISDSLTELGISPDDPESVKNLSAEGILGYVAGLVSEAAKKPLRLILIGAVFAAICRVSMSLSYKGGVYGEFFVIICFIAVSPMIIGAFGSAVKAMLGCQSFMLTYIPAFAAVAAASGNVTAAVSYNAVLMYFCEGAAALASGVLRPVLSCMLVLAAAQAINPGLMNITSALRNALTVAIGFIMTLFLGVLSLQTIVGRGADGLIVRAGKYAVSSFVPVIGYSLSESYKAVSLSLGAIRTAVGAFGIVVLALIMLSPIITALIYKAACSVCAWLSAVIGADRISALFMGFRDVVGLLGTVLTVFMLMMVVSTGMLALLGGELSA